MIATDPVPHRIPLWPQTLGALVIILLWDATGWDIAVAAWTATATGFPMRDHWLLTKVLHDGARAVVFVMLVWLLISIFRPTGVLRRLARTERIWLFAATVGAMLMVSTFKRHSTISCPWDLQQFGGLARYLSHWDWRNRDGGPGHCFPAGHASAGFAWVCGFFAFRRHGNLACRWLALALAGGFVLGVAQQLKGAHFFSHTLWTGWLCWMWAWSCSALLPQGTQATAVKP